MGIAWILDGILGLGFCGEMLFCFLLSCLFPWFDGLRPKVLFPVLSLGLCFFELDLELLGIPRLGSARVAQSPTWFFWVVAGLAGFIFPRFEASSVPRGFLVSSGRVGIGVV